MSVAESSGERVSVQWQDYPALYQVADSASTTGRRSDSRAVQARAGAGGAGGGPRRDRGVHSGPARDRRARVSCS